MLLDEIEVQWNHGSGSCQLPTTNYFSCYFCIYYYCGFRSCPGNAYTYSYVCFKSPVALYICIYTSFVYILIRCESCFLAANPALLQLASTCRTCTMTWHNHSRSWASEWRKGLKMKPDFIWGKNCYSLLNARSVFRGWSCMIMMMRVQQN
jgi:hypothetical protein